MIADLRLYLVTDPAFADLSSVVESAVAGGVTCVQVRDKHASTVERAAFVRALRQVLPDTVAVIVNDDLEAAQEGDGLHVGLDDIRPSAARVALGPRAVIGWSINDFAQLDDEAELAACDYVAASPVWATATKTDTSAPFGLAGVRTLAERLGGRLPLVAIGGIDVTNAEQVVSAGADGVAVVSAICAAVHPAGAARKLLAAVERGLLARGARG